MIFLAGLAVAGGAAAIGTGTYKKIQEKRARKMPLVDALIDRSTEQGSRTELVTWNQAILESDKRRRKTYLAAGTLLTAGALLGGGYWLLAAAGLTPLVLTNQLIFTLGANPLSPYIFTGLYAIRPLTLFPPFLMSIAGGMLFGPVWGTLLVLAGLNASAVVSYLVGRYFGEHIFDSENSVIERYITWLRKKPFESILTMHLLCLPYDLVNTVAGFMKVEWKQFWIATAIGAIPGAVSLTLLGASIETSALAAVPTLNPVMLAASGVVLAGSFAISYYVKPSELELDGPVLAAA